jgi:dienelactone hydrolase
MPDSYRSGAPEATSRRFWLEQSLLGLAAAATTALGATPPSRLPRDRLLLYRNRAGKLREATSRSQWLRRRADIIHGFQAIAGPLPGRDRRCALDLRVDEEVDAGSYLRRAISYQAEPGGRVPAYLLVPKKALSGAKCPAALCLHQTHAAGRKVVVGLGNSPDDEYAVELAQRGFVCLAPPYPWLADYQPDLDGLGYASGTMKAIWDNLRGVDLLESLGFVRRDAIVAIGHSLGGHNAIFTSVHEPRIKVVITSCAFDSFVDYMGGNITGWTQNRYLPRLRDYLGRPAEIPFDFHELVGALAPRGLFVNAPLGDSNFRWQSVDRIASAAQPVYALYHADKNLVVRHPDCPHRFPPELRREAYAFIDARIHHAG